MNDTLPAPAPSPAPVITTAICDFGHMDRVDLAALRRAGIEGVLLKATEGCDWTDPAFAARLTEAHQLGFSLGAYHFGRPGDPAAQAAHFLAVVRDACAATGDIDPATLRLMLDDEPEKGTEMSQAEALAFLDAASAAVLDGPPPLYYGFLSSLRGRYPDATARIGTYPLVLSAFGPDPRTMVGDHLPAPWRGAGWALMQYTNGAAGPADQGTFPRHVPGVGGCDRSCFRGSVADLQTWWLGPRGAACGP